MKKIVILFFTPLILSLGVLYCIALDKQINTFLFSSNSTEVDSSTFNYIINFNDNPFYENQFLNPSHSTTTIYLLGSSELAEGGAAIPYNFIPNHFNSNVKAIGHAGNQCFSMYMQLLANSSRLNSSKICFIISPGWFDSKASKGTSSQAFLEYNSEYFLKNILFTTCNPFQSYASKRIAQLYTEFNTPNIPLKLLNFEHQSSKSIFHKTVYYPLISLNYFLLAKKDRIMKQKKYSFKTTSISTKDIIPKKNVINWDSLASFSKSEVLKNVTNNKMGIADDYYTEYIKGKRGNIQAVNESVNQELTDFKMLVKLVKSKNVNATFIISPLNAFYYKNLEDLNPTINSITTEIQNANFNYLNFFVTDINKYEKATLHDIMHFSDYAWYKIDKFMIETYKL